MRRRISVLSDLTALVVLAVTSAIPAFCQDLVVIAPNQAKVEYEDSRVRVVRLKLAPNDIIPTHDRPYRIVIPLTPNDVTTTAADGRAHDVKAPAGIPAWSAPGKRSVTNHAAPLENIVVELKNVNDAPQALSAPPMPRPADYLQEKYHRRKFENQYVRVYDMHIPPGETTEFHLHALDTVLVFVNGAHIEQQPKDGQWSGPDDIAPGTVEFSADAAKPRIHRVKNDSKNDFHVVLVQLKK